MHSSLPPMHGPSSDSTSSPVTRASRCRLMARRSRASCYSSGRTISATSPSHGENRGSSPLGSARCTILYDGIPVWERHPAKCLIQQEYGPQVCHFRPRKFATLREIHSHGSIGRCDDGSLRHFSGPRTPATRANETFAMDLVRDQLAIGQKLRVLLESHRYQMGYLCAALVVDLPGAPKRNASRRRERQWQLCFRPVAENQVRQRATKHRAGRDTAAVVP